MRKFLLGSGLVSLFIAFGLFFVPYLYPMKEFEEGYSPFNMVIPWGIFSFFLLACCLTYASHTMRQPQPGTDISRAVAVASGTIVLVIIFAALMYISGVLVL